MKSKSPQVIRNEKLQNEFKRRKKVNSRYSIRLFAKECGVSAAFMSYFLRGKRSLSYDQYIEVNRKLKLPDEQTAPPPPTTTLKNDRHLGQYKSTEFVEYPVQENSESITWMDLIISDLTGVHRFKNDVVWIGKTLGIPPHLVTDSIEKLIRLKILEVHGEKLKKTRKKIYLSTDKSVQNVRDYHRELITRALQQLDKTDSQSFENRLITGASFTLSPKVLTEIKKRMNNFTQEIVDLASKSEPQASLYQLNLQLFPLFKP